MEIYKDKKKEQYYINGKNRMRISAQEIVNITNEGHDYYSRNWQKMEVTPDIKEVILMLLQKTLFNDI